MRVNDVHCNRKQRQLTIMLVTVSLSFYLFTTPAVIYFIKEMNTPKHRNLGKHKRDFLFSQISVVLSELNNAVSRFSLRILRLFSFALFVAFSDQFSFLLFYRSTFSTCDTTNFLSIFWTMEIILSSIYPLQSTV